MGKNRSFRARFLRHNHFLCFENSKWPPYLARQNILKIGMATPERYTSTVIKVVKITHLARFSRYKPFYVLQFLRKV